MGGRNKLVALVAMGGAGFARLQNPAAAPVAGLSFLSHFQPACQVDTSSSQSLFQVIFGENASSCFALPAFSHSRPLTLLSLVTLPFSCSCISLPITYRTGTHALKNPLAVVFKIVMVKGSDP